MLSTTATTGSRAPWMAVGVDRISWMARVVHPSDNTVGITAKAARLSHPALWAGTVGGIPAGMRAAKSAQPHIST